MMRNLRRSFQILQLLAICSLAHAKVPFRELTLDQALGYAQVENNFVLVDFYSDLCQPCLMMDQTTLKDSEVISTLKTDWVSIRIDVDANETLAKKYAIETIPSYVAMRADGSEIGRFTGLTSRDTFLEELKYLKQGFSISQLFTDRQFQKLDALMKSRELIQQRLNEAKSLLDQKQEAATDKPVDLMAIKNKSDLLVEHLRKDYLILMGVGRRDMARAASMAVVKLTDTSPTVLNAMAWDAYELGLSDKHTTDLAYEAMKATDFDNLDILDTYVRVLAQSGNIDKAKQRFSEFRQKNLHLAEDPIMIQLATDLNSGRAGVYRP